MAVLNPFAIENQGAAGLGAGPGIGAGSGTGGGFLNSLLQNKLFLQYLSDAGGAMSTGKPVGEALNKVTQQNISSQNYTKLLHRMLSGDMPEDAKIVHTADGTVIHMPKSALGGDGSSGTSTESPKPVGQVSPFNSSQPSISAADLAGLTPEMISNVLQFKNQQDAMKRQTINDTLEQMNRTQQVEHANKSLALETRKVDLDERALFNKENKPIPVEALDQPSPYTSPGVGKLTNRQFSELTPEEKNYTIYATALGPDAKPMSRKEFKDMDLTSQEKFLGSLMNDPKKMAAEIKLRRAGVTPLTEVLEKDVAVSRLSGQKYFDNPDITKDIDSHIKSESVQNKIFNESRNLVKSGKVKNSAEGDKIATRNETIKYIEGQISAGGGKIVLNEDGTPKKRREGNKLIWTVKWPDTKDSKGNVIRVGDITEVEHGI
jgi:hypothetical protein